MCTVTYLPADNQSFILTSNRDEQASRPHAILPNILEINDRQIVCPIDAKAKGTWIATSNHRTICLLNGAFVPHQPKEKYRMSRGQVVLDSFLYQSIEQFLDEYELADIEPFTLILINHLPLTMTELIWDGTQKNITSKDTATPAIWSSVTLYPPAVVAERQNWFDEFLKNNINGGKQLEDLSKIVDFHRFGGNGDKRNGIMMNRNNFLLTVSITSIQVDDKMRKMTYYDLVNEQEKEIIY
ncbi:MAG: NRDE family protein [Thermoflexibacter sp.]|jgi:uncharacterized protein with NRDE domain|nr:NRDE family protein [Thermoflexibacter sp.]